MKQSKKFVLAIALVVSFVSIIGIIGFSNPKVALAGNSGISVWWPEQNANLSSVQPFKSLVDSLPVENYEMYWQVDGGKLNHMPSSYADYPHKEASVDVSGWRWSSNGSYDISFVAKDKNGNQIAQKSVKIIVNAPANTSLSNVSASLISSPVAVSISTAITLSPSPVPTPVATPVITPTPTPQSAVSPVLESSYGKVAIWWPVDGVTVAADQPFKALVDGLAVTKYNMYWQVDGGKLNNMPSNYTDSPHKEALVNVSSWNWKGVGPYVVNFVAKNRSGKIIAQKSVRIYNGSIAESPAILKSSPTPTPLPTPTPTPLPAAFLAPTPTPSPTPVPTPLQAPSPTPVPSKVSTDNPFSGLSFYVDPNSNAKRQADAWRLSRPTDAAQMDKIALQSAAKWLGDWNADIYSDTKAYVDSAEKLGQVPVMIAYNIPQRDCGHYSAGGSAGALEYKTWITSLAKGIGSRRAVVILEPDAMSLIDCLSSEAKEVRFDLIDYAISTLKANGRTVVHVDAGNSNWVNATDMAARLNSSGIAKADGFAVNVSNYYWTSDAVRFGKELSAKVGGKHFIVDTSRNGLGPNGGEWCNPLGRALGIRPTDATNEPLVDAFLWLKAPGESDGYCNGGPSAGVWWPEYALGLAERAAY